MNHYSKADRVISNLIKNGKKKFILFPFGEQGILIKDILNKRYGILEEYIIDNKLEHISDNDRIISLKDVEKIDLEDKLVLLTSDNEEIYSEIRYQLMRYVDLEHIIDVFSHSMYFDYEMYYEATEFKHPRLSALEAAAREIYYNRVGGQLQNVAYIRENSHVISVDLCLIESYICLIHFRDLIQGISIQRKKKCLINLGRRQI